MIGRLFKKQRTLYTQLSEKEIFDNLAKHSIGGNVNNKTIKTFFRGTFDRENHTFSLLQVFDYGPNNQIRPVINGKIETLSDKNIIHLTIDLPKYLALIIDLAIVLNILACTAFLLLPLPESFPTPFMLVAIPVAFILFVLFGKGFFNSKYSDCEILIKRLTEAN